MIRVLHTAFVCGKITVSYYPKYQINNMKAKLSKNSFFGDSDRGEIRVALPQDHPQQKPEVPQHMVSGGQSSLIFFSSTHLEY